MCLKSPAVPRDDLNNEVFSLFPADGPPVVGHYDISDTDSNQESINVEAVRPTVIKHELKTHRGQDLTSHSGCIRALSSIAGQLQTQFITTGHFFSVRAGLLSTRVSSINILQNGLQNHVIVCHHADWSVYFVAPFFLFVSQLQPSCVSRAWMLSAAPAVWVTLPLIHFRTSGAPAVKQGELSTQSPG